MHLLLDIGSTKTKIAVAPDLNGFEEPRVINTPQDFDEGIQTILRHAKEMSAGEKFVSVAVGVAGPLDPEKMMLTNSPHMPDWIEKPLKNMIQDELQANVKMENDMALAGLGEAVNGAGNGADIVVYLAVNTGVGGVRVVQKKIDVSTMGFEPGHQIIGINEEMKTPIRLEDYISGTAIEMKYNKEPEEMKSKQFWDEIAYYLAIGIHNTILHWSPDVIVLGGLVMEGIDVDVVRRHVREVLSIFPDMPEIRKSELTPFSGLHGGLVLLKS